MVTKTERFDLVNRTNFVQNFLNMFIAYLYMFRANYVSIIRRNYRTYATPGICHSETSGYFKITWAYVIKWRVLFTDH